MDVVNCILENKRVISKRLIGTIIQTNKIDPLFETVKEIALSLYKP